MNRSHLLTFVLVAAGAVACQSAVVQSDEGTNLGSAKSALSAAQCDYFEVGGTTKICHATGSVKNPFVLLSVSTDACAAAHTAHVRDTIAVNGSCGANTCLPNGAPVDATMPCCDGLTNRNGVCQPTDLCIGVTCSDADQCHHGTCDSTTGRCAQEAINNFPCNDGNACTSVDSCQAGACTGGSPTVCSASDQCHAVGTCAPATGVCSNPPSPDGSPCNDQNLCTRTDLCQGGTCVGANPIICTPPDECQVVASNCNPSTGGCSFVPKPDGTSCAGGQGQCTQGRCGPLSAPTSCKKILDSGQSHGDDVYGIAVGGATVQVYCDMTTGGGGWTLCFADKYQGKGTDVGSAFDYLTSTWDTGSRVFTRGAANAGSAWGNFCPLMVGGSSPATEVFGASYGQDGALYQGATCALATGFFAAGNALVNLTCGGTTSLCSYNKPIGTASVSGLDYGCQQYNEGSNQGSSLNFNPTSPNQDYAHGTMTYTNMHSTCGQSGDQSCTGGWCYECAAMGSSTFSQGNLKTLLLYVR